MEDKQGIPVELGGSSVNNLADDLQTFGLAPGSQNLFAATYTVFGNIQHHEYPSLVPSFPKWDSVTDLSFLKAVAQAAGGKTGSADLAVFKKDDSLKQLVSRRSWKINFETGSARFTPETSATLDELTRQLEIAGGTLVEIHGHTDNVGTAETNQQLSEQRAFAVKSYLEGKSPANFPQGRVKVFAHGMNQPVVPNTSAANRAKNRRVEIVLGT
jgi:outer membrane protein OmpA-like peptidoglycan-associated protein